MLVGTGICFNYASFRSYRATLAEAFHAAATRTSAAISAGSTDVTAAEGYAEALVIASLANRLAPIEREELRTRMQVNVSRKPSASKQLSYSVTIKGSFTPSLPFIASFAGLSEVTVAGSSED